jgi:hypothetical protein
VGEVCGMWVPLRAHDTKGGNEEVHVVLKGCGTEVKLPHSQFLLGLILSLTHFYYLFWQVI